MTLNHFLNLTFPNIDDLYFIIDPTSEYAISMQTKADTGDWKLQ